MASSFERLTAKQVRDNYREQFFVADLEKPTIVDAMAGDPDGLIHKDKLGAALAVKIPLWDDRPPEGLFNVLTLECLLSSSPEWVRRCPYDTGVSSQALWRAVFDTRSWGLYSGFMKCLNRVDDTLTLDEDKFKACGSSPVPAP